MEVLFSFLNWTSSFSHIDEDTGSKMDIHNLATVITPNILYPNAKNSTVDESFMAIEAVNALITYNDNMCEVGNSYFSHHGLHQSNPSFRFQRTCNPFSATLLSLRKMLRCRPRISLSDMGTSHEEAFLRSPKMAGRPSLLPSPNPTSTMTMRRQLVSRPIHPRMLLGKCKPRFAMYLDQMVVTHIHPVP